MSDESNRDRPMTEQEATVSHSLRRLQQAVQSEMPATMAKYAMSSFTLHQEPLPEEAYARVLVLVYPQDPFVGEPEVRSMSTADIGDSLINSRFKIEDNSSEAAIPDADGNYLYWPNKPQFDQVNSFYYATVTLRMLERYARRALPWSFPTPRITINPHMGDDANAFYNESEQLLGFHTFTLEDKIISTAQSADIISHETGHAVLDGLRNLYNESFGLGSTAFHESFGDMSAMLIALHDDSLVRRLIEWTQGDLRMANFVTAVAEQLTDALQHKEKFVRRHTIYLRNALNIFQNVPFDELTYEPIDPETELGRQSHNYSRLFSGAFYDILVGIYERFKHESEPAHVALYRARDTLGRLLITAVELGPVGELTFEDMAKAFIAADQLLYDSRDFPVLVEVFSKRGLLTQETADTFLQTMKTLPEVYLPETLNMAMASALFLEKEILPSLSIKPDDELLPIGAYRNSAGHAFLTYYSTRQVLLNGEQFKQFKGANISMYGGLTLAFDTQNRLRSAIYRPVTEEDIRQTRIMTGDLIQHGLIVDNLTPSQIYIRQPPPHGIIIPPTSANAQTPRGKARLVKLPIIVDVIPEPLNNFARYVQKMWQQTKKD